MFGIAHRGTRWAWISITACLAFSAAQATPQSAMIAGPGVSDNSSGQVSQSSVVQDLKYFRDVWALKDRSFTPAAHATMAKFIDRQIAHARPMGRADLALIFAEAQAMSGNNHTQTDYFREEGLFHSLPLSFWRFPDGAVITRAHPSVRELLGARILAIGGIPTDQAEARVSRYVAGTDERRRYLAPLWLTRMEVLEAAGLAHDGVADFEVRLANGRVERRALGVAPSPDPAAYSPEWQQSMVPGKGPNPWPHVLDGLATLPLYLQPRNELSSARLDQGRVLYIRSMSLSPYTDESYAVMIKSYTMITGIFEGKDFPSDIVVDLRYNEGGNFFNALDLSTELAGLVARKNGRIYVITGRATNSAAIIFTALLKASTRGRTVIVGEEASDHLWFWSEGGRFTRLRRACHCIIQTASTIGRTAAGTGPSVTGQRSSTVSRWGRYAPTVRSNRPMATMPPAVTPCSTLFWR